MPEPPTQHRQLCSGKQPCDTCRALNRECVFDETLDQRRHVAAKRTAEELDYYRGLFNDLLRAMREGDRSSAIELVDMIRRDATNEELRLHIGDMLRVTGSGREEVEEVVSNLEDIQNMLNEDMTQSWRPQVMDIQYLCVDAPYRVPAQPWTNVTTDSDLVSHLVSLYFTWDYPFHTFLDRDVFLKHMMGGDINSEFCSPFLVNALLANACHFSEYLEAYARPGDIMTKGGDFLAEAERLRQIEPPKLSLTYIQGILLLHERYSLYGQNDCGYKMLHLAIWTGEALGLVGERKPVLASNDFPEDMDASLRRTAWGLFQIDTLITQTRWLPYPTSGEPKESFLSDYFDISCNLSEIARDMSHCLFASDRKALSAVEQIKIKEVLFQRLREWTDGLPPHFKRDDEVPPYVLVMKMRYHALIIILLLFHAEDEILGATTEGFQTPESLTSPSPLLDCNKRETTESAARAIATLVRIQRQNYGMAHAHHFAMYAINLALFVLVERHGKFDILDNVFLFLASAFASIASRSQLGRNLFHLFRQSVRAKRQGSRLRHSPAVNDEMKMLFDEECTLPSAFDEFANGLEKLDADERYHVLGHSPWGSQGTISSKLDQPMTSGRSQQHPLCYMLDRYESLSCGKDDIAQFRIDLVSAANPNAGSQSVNPVDPASELMWRARVSAADAPLNPAMPLYSYGQYPDLNGSLPLPQPERMRAPKIAIPRATALKTTFQRRRSARACEPCRQRKVKCDAGRPMCQKCREHGLDCLYIDIKRIRDQKQLGILREKVERYEKLLKELETESDSTTAKRIRKVLAAPEQPSVDNGEDADDSDAGSSTSQGSLDEIDLVKEDLNRSDKTVAVGFFGKNSEIAWMQKLENVSEQREHGKWDGEKPARKDISINSMSYHLDDLSIPFPDTVNPYAVPEKELADKFFNAYMDSVHPSFTVVRRRTFTAQYEQFYKKKQQFSPPRKWLAVLNMVFALGCRYCRLTGKVAADERDTDDTMFLNRARLLCLSGNVLFEYDDLQQIQVILLVAVYLVALGQVNGGSKFSSMALRSAISLGINLRFQDENTPVMSKEARTRLWWSIFQIEHIITSMTGRISGCNEGLSAALLPVPFSEEGADRNPGLSEIYRDRNLRCTRLQLTLFQNKEQAESAGAWLSKCEPSPALLFHMIIDLNIIAQAVINSVYSIQGLRQSTLHLEQRLHRHSQSMDNWLRKVPNPYRFFISPEDDTLHLPPRATEGESDYTRERITLAVYYYSARITLCRPCLSHSPTPLQKAGDSKSRGNFRALMTLTCLRSSIFLLSILPETPDTAWLISVTPWWSILHYLMQATTALLICLTTRSGDDADGNIPQFDKSTIISQTSKALRWLHHLGVSSLAAARAFTLCESFVRRMGPSLGFDLSDLPSSNDFPNEGGDFDMIGIRNPGSEGTLDGLVMVDDG
ncbi:fungal-specific transcription factor domain-containing protein [Aspergillus desertorum]